MRQITISLLALLILTGCSLFDGPEEEVAATQTAAVAIEEPTATPEPTPVATDPASSELRLTVWVVEEASTLSETPGGSILAEQISAFEFSQPGIIIDVEIKNPTGPGGTMSFLRSGRLVAPSILPDLIILPTDELATAFAEEIIYPLDGLVNQEAIDDLFPAASDLSRVDDTVIGYPFTLSNLSQMAYSTDIFTDSVPLNLPELTSREAITFTFPAAGRPGAELALQLYLEAGGQINEEPGQPILEVEPLTEALTQLSLAAESGVILPESTMISTYSESWLLFQTGSVNTTQADETPFTNIESIPEDISHAGLPGARQPLPALVKGFSWAISANESEQQLLAAELLNWLVAGPNIGDWSLEAARLPGRRAAFEQWPAEDPYVIFARQQLELAQPYPNSVDSAVLDVLRSAVVEVLNQTMSPLEAAEIAVSSLTP
jgi:ABC-type glycerol-3-phosphate transport system substrate-binding protein